MIVQESIDFLRTNIPKGEKILVCFSGGKDSIVIEKLVELSGIEYDLCYSFTGIDPPEIVRFIRKHYPKCIFKRPTLTFWHSITTKNPPLVHARWCCTELKKKPTWKLPHKHRIMGIRKEESDSRSKYPRINEFSYRKLRHTYYYPILDWTEDMVWQFIEDYNLPYPKLYEEFDRIGCVICPFSRILEHDIRRKKWPKFYKAFEKYVAIWFNKRLAQGKDLANNSPEEFCEDWYKHKATWYKGRIK